MTLSMPLTKVGDRIATLPEELLQEPALGVVKVTRDGKPVLAILPWELYAVMLETLDFDPGISNPGVPDSERGPKIPAGKSGSAA